MPRPASDVEVVMIVEGKCPHCGSDDMEMDDKNMRVECNYCNVCGKYYTIFSSGYIELEGGVA